jgi:hypothetical protein
MPYFAILAILASNAATLVTAQAQDWPLTLLLWPYWLQSLVIGGFAGRRMHALQRFSTHNVTLDDQPAQPTAKTKRKIVMFFAMHYGGFHLFYLVFLVILTHEGSFGRAPLPLDWWLFAALGLGFVLSHGLSHRLNLAADIRHEHNIGAMMALPYARVLPMHLMILLGMQFEYMAHALLLFVALKTAADLLMHVVEHRWLQRSSVPGWMHFSIGGKGD